MARGAAQARRKAAKQQTRRRQTAARRPPTVEQTMFFPRLRRQAKWVFVLLVFVFAAGFVFFGVGSGSTGIGDLLRGNFNLFGSGGSKISSGVQKALKQTRDHPTDPNAWNTLATAYQTDGKTAEATTALEHYLQLRPNDVQALQRVAGYYETVATNKDADARNLAAQAPLQYGNVIGVSSTSQLGQVLGQDQITQQLSQQVNADFTASSTALRKDEQLYQRIAKLQPDDVNTQFHLAQLADFLRDTKVALAAYRKVVKLAPSDPSATTARQRIAVLALSTRTGK
jgi:cytochrome c-type biogenesis protein CcmH/NrfG